MDLKKNLRLRTFNPTKDLPNNFNMVILGHKFTGKSTFMRDMLYHLHLKGMPRVVVYSGTEAGNDFYSKCIPHAYIHNGIDLEEFRKVYETQRTIVSSWRAASTQVANEMDLRLVIVLDDLMYKKQMTRSELFGEIFMNGRHWLITVILSCQYIMNLDVACRANLDYLVCLREPIPKNKNKIYENFFGMFAKKDIFFQVLDACTQNYEALILNRTEPTTDVSRCIYWYKSNPNLPPFVFGSESAKRWADL